MQLLLDTHTIIWWDSEPAQLSSPPHELCQDQSHILSLSVVSVWEMLIKSQLGKLTLNLPLAKLVENQQRINQVHVLSTKLDHILELDNLPLHHKDPFDRLLIAQARIEEATLLSKDNAFSAYPVETIW
ncbi:MAG: type II toxin-antitoxin system VapC family toxin [Chloroflexi bacterium]|nr:type II toxin-antitoxin system VapC family toxin [Chloroflexota bacterium]